MLIGLDCAEPSLVLERWRDELPTLSGLMERGSYGRLTSVIPPITVPAWSCMMSSKTPGDLGVYGFRNRSDHTYDGGFIAMSTAIKEPRLWDLVTRAGGSSIVLSVPGRYPPKPLNGVMVGCFLTPSLDSKYTYPAALKDEIADVVGEYLFDTKDFRTDDKEYLLRQVYEMTDRRFALAEHFLETKPWSLFAMVEMGPDRMHHGFWKYMDPEHRKHEPGNPYERAILDYHRHLDGLIGKLLEHADVETVVFVLSDHGAKRLDGGIRINEWLRQEGLLATLAEPDGLSSLRDVGVDWSRTTAWGEGGYYARMFLNVAGREPEGTVPPEEYESNLLPVQVTFDPSDPSFYQSHVYQSYPQSGLLSTYPDRVTLRVYLQPVGLDVFDDLVQSGDLVDNELYRVDELRAALQPLTVGEELTWTLDTASETYVEGGLPVACVSKTNLLANADKVPAVRHARCGR